MQSGLNVFFPHLSAHATIYAKHPECCIILRKPGEDRPLFI
jgi:hypothetical protein